MSLIVREITSAMGRAVAERTYLRKKLDGSWETWEDVANRVALGNSSLDPRFEAREEEFVTMRRVMAKGILPMSGRHLEHGDAHQSGKWLEIFSNCSCSATSFFSLKLLLDGSGVGRSYDDDLMLVDWDNAPNIITVLDESHPDFRWGTDFSKRDAQHRYGKDNSVKWITVEDSREGWSKALEIYEMMAFEKIHRDKMLILDFSLIRKKGSPIRGMQGKPATGPNPIMDAFKKTASIKGARMPRWKQSMFVDHYFAEGVLVGNVRRAARMAMKYWKDPGILEYIEIKRPIEFEGLTVDQVAELRENRTKQGLPPFYSFLWSANNSVAVDKEFWDLVRDKNDNSELALWAKKVFNRISECSYGDGNGEPGYVNVDLLTQNTKGLKDPEYKTGQFWGSKRYQVEDETEVFAAKIAKIVSKKKYPIIVNPCLSLNTTLLTQSGIRTLRDVNIGDTIWSGKRWTKVINKWKTGTKPVYKYSTNAGYFLGTDNHRIVQNGTKIEVDNAESIDIAAGVDLGVNLSAIPFHSNLVIDGLLLGDGYTHHKHILLCVGENDQDYWNESDLGNFIDRSPYGNAHSFKVTNSGLLFEELAVPIPERKIPQRLMTMSHDETCSLLRGIFSANGSVFNASPNSLRVSLKGTCREYIEQVQLLLSSIGIVSYISTNKPSEVEWPNGKFFSKQSYNLQFSGKYVNIFKKKIGFIQKYKTEILNNVDIKSGNNKTSYEIISKEFVGVEDVYDITVDDPEHVFWSGGHLVSNCGEIVFYVVGSFCVIADLIPYHASSLEEIIEAAEIATRALIRVNLMDSIYNQEVKRTNRIGVGITGWHEWAWDHFGLGFRDLLDEKKSSLFWRSVSKIGEAIRKESIRYSNLLGVEPPHTALTSKPSGSISKLWILSEGAHLPSMDYMLRWVQFNKDNPLVQQYRDSGYPIRELTTYPNTVVVGFPTLPTITGLGIGDKLVLAGDATPEEQFKWLQLIEKYWIKGLDENGQVIENDLGNQISYTLKYKPELVSFKEFKKMTLEYQPTVRCCSVMPQEDSSSYEYLPEERITETQYHEIVNRINKSMAEDIGREHLDCSSGACPITYRDTKDE